jgi:hypothetical protein
MSAQFEDRERHGMVFAPSDIEEHASAVLVAKDVADYLERAYPGWLWALSASGKTGICSIRSMRLSAEWGYILKMKDIQDDPVRRRRLVLRAAGDILERFGVKPGRYTREQFMRIKRDVAGRPMPDLSDKLGKVRKRYRDDALTAAVKNGAVSIRWNDLNVGAGRTYRQILIASATGGPDVPRR